MSEPEELQEFEYREDWAREQFNEMDSDLAVKLLGDAISKGKNLADFLKDRWAIATELGQGLIEKGIIKVGTEDSKFRDVLAIGIDSSRQLPYRILNTYFCPITSAIVYFNGIDSEMKYDPNAPCKFFEESDLTPDQAIKRVKEEMYRCEVSAILRASSSIASYGRESDQRGEVVIMIDGPLIDPPSEELYDEYVKERVTALLACKESGALVIGCVKSLEGHHFLEFLKSRQDLSELATMAEGFGSDPQLVPFIFHTIQSVSPMLETIPIERKVPDWLVAKYKTHGLKNIFRIYLTMYGRVFCTEYFTLDEDPIELGKKVCQVVRAWSIPGFNAPLPVLAAHRRCNIKRGSAEFLYRELLTRALTWEEGARMFGPLAGGP